jgi:hypothetical protein
MKGDSAVVRLRNAVEYATTERTNPVGRTLNSYLSDTGFEIQREHPQCC